MEKSFSVFFALLACALLLGGCISSPQGGNAQNQQQNPQQPISNTSAQQNASAQQEENQQSPAAYLDYDQQEYESARALGKLIYIEFYSPDCVPCVYFDSQVRDAFSQMAKDRKYDNVAGFRADATNEELAAQFNVSAPNTHLIISRDGSMLIRATEEWDSQRLMDSISQAR